MEGETIRAIAGGSLAGIQPESNFIPKRSEYQYFVNYSRPKNRRRKNLRYCGLCLHSGDSRQPRS
jgi:hypothetical protein